MVYIHVNITFEPRTQLTIQRSQIEALHLEYLASESQVHYIPGSGRKDWTKPSTFTTLILPASPYRPPARPPARPAPAKNVVTPEGVTTQPVDEIEL
jgi:hypothetical protein